MPTDTGNTETDDDERADCLDPFAPDGGRWNALKKTKLNGLVVYVCVGEWSRDCYVYRYQFWCNNIVSNTMVHFIDNSKLIWWKRTTVNQR